MYGEKITTEYGRANEIRRAIIGEVGCAPAGNITFRLGKLHAPEGKEPKGWAILDQVTTKPSEAVALAAEILEKLIGNDRNLALIDATPFILSDVNEHGILGKLQELADDLALAEAETF